MTDLQDRIVGAIEDEEMQTLAQWVQGQFCTHRQIYEVEGALIRAVNIIEEERGR